jgi:hypothetical protein
MSTKQLSDGSGDGVSLGQSTTDKVSFYGATPVAQQVCTSSAALTAGETTPADIAAAFVELYTALKTSGIVG